MTGYVTVYDLINDPGSLQPPYFLNGLWLVLTALAVWLAVVATRREWRFLAFWWILAAALVIGNISSVLDFMRFEDARQAIQNGRYTTVEGCLDSYRLGRSSNGRRGAEVCSVAGQTFEYRPYQHGYGYNHIAADGGSVFADSWVRVTYLPYMQSNRIIRLEVAHHVCPAAGWSG